MDQNKIEYSKPVPPFVRYCSAIIPTMFDDSLSYYEALCALWKWLQDNLVDVINHNAAATEEYARLVNELKEYVENYFDNLDVQEEINNKLDEMAEDGQLADIIAQYLQLAGVIVFNTLTDLKNAENIANGSICRTLGKSSYKDGHGDYYKIRPITSADTVDDLNIVAIEISDTLIAERITEAYDWTNPITFGADPTGVADSSTAINNCIVANLGGSVNFSGGTYRVDSPIITPYYVDEQVNIDFNGAIIKAHDNTLPYVIGIGMYNYSDSVRPNRNNYHTPSCSAVIDNVKIEANGCAIGIFTNNLYWYPRIVNSSIIGAIIGIKAGTGGQSTDLALDNCYVECPDYTNTNTICLQLNGNDNKISNCRFYGACIGVDINGNGNFFSNSHVYLYGHLNDRESEGFETNWNNTIAVRLKGSNNYFNCFYTDSYHIHYKYNYETRTNVNLIISNSFAYSNVTGHDDIFIDASSHANLYRLDITNTYVTLRVDSDNGSAKNRGIVFDSEQNFEVLFDALNLHGNIINDVEKDILLVDTTKNVSVPYSPALQFEGDKYYVVGYIPFPVERHSATMRITNTNYLFHQSARIWCNASKVMSLNATELSNPSGTGTAQYGIGIKKINVNGMDMAEISVMRHAAYEAKFGIELFPHADNQAVLIPAYNGIARLQSLIETTPDSTITFGY